MPPLNVLKRKSAARPCTKRNSTAPLTVRNSEFSRGFWRKETLTGPLTVCADPEPATLSISTSPLTLRTRKVPWISRTTTRHPRDFSRSEEHTSELQSRRELVFRLLLEKKNATPTLAGTM